MNANMEMIQQCDKMSLTLYFQTSMNKQYIIIVLVIIMIIIRILLMVAFSKRKISGLLYHNVGKNIITFDIQEFLDIPKCTSMDFSNGNIFISNRDGKLYLGKKLLYDVKDEPEFDDQNWEQGLMCVKLHPKFTSNKLLYLAYTVKGDDQIATAVVVNEYTFNGEIQKKRELLRVGYGELYHHAGTLDFDSKDNLYLSTGDGGPQGDPGNFAQRLDNFRGKILRINSDTNTVDIVAYGLRNPWKFSIDSKDRMFIGDVGFNSVESFYMLSNLYPKKPYNMGWNAYEGSKVFKGGIDFKDTVHPIFEYAYDKENNGGCAIGGYYIPNKDIYVCADYFGFVRALRGTTRGATHQYAIHQIGLKKFENKRIYSLAYDKSTSTVYMLEKDKIYKLNIQIT